MESSKGITSTGALIFSKTQTVGMIKSEGIVSTGVLVSTGLPQIATPAANPASNLPFVGVMYGMGVAIAILIATSITLVILFVHMVVLHHKHRRPASGQQEHIYDYTISPASFPPPLPPPRLITQDNPAYERITLNDCVAYSNGLNQDQQLEPQTLSHIVTTV